MKIISLSIPETRETTTRNDKRTKDHIENIEKMPEIPDDHSIGIGINSLKMDKKKFLGHLKHPNIQKKMKQVLIRDGVTSMGTNTKGGRTLEMAGPQKNEYRFSLMEEKIITKKVQAAAPVINKPSLDDSDDFDQCQYESLPTQDKSQDVEKSQVSVLEETLKRKKTDNQAQKEVDVKKREKLNLVPIHCLNLYKNDLASMRILRSKNKKYGDLGNLKNYHSTKFVTTTKSILKPCSYDIDSSSMKREHVRSVTPDKNVKFNKKKLVYKFKKDSSRSYLEDRFHRARSTSSQRNSAKDERRKRKRKKTKVSLKWFVNNKNKPREVQNEADYQTKSLFYKPN